MIKRKLSDWKYKEKIFCYKNPNKYHLNPNPYWKLVKEIVLDENRKIYKYKEVK